MKNWIHKIWEGILAGVAHMVIALLGVIMRVLYPGQVIFNDSASKVAIKQGAILIANHTSHKDGFFAPKMLSKRKVYVLVTRKWYDKKFLNPLFRHLRYIPINLEEQDAAWMVQAETILKKGQCVLIFPEGKLETDGVLETFHSGFLLLARHLNVPVVPMAITGGYRVFHKQTLHIGSPLQLDLHAKGRLSVVLDKAAEQCKQEVFALVHQEK
ncbi:MAG: 1-acyl-sn-glycerol-3-phosphate acyltransferase [Ruminococcus sp.]|nr:1-acyl-sn-glycerol-3-phosphate acyltransferase [Ruminococcus sp.]